jgi:predicted RNase H-like nuclease
MLHRGGPELPYQIIAGVVPCNSGWLTASCKIAGVTMSIEEPMIFDTFAEILDYKPAFSVIGVHAPIGFLDEATPKGRECDKLAREMLGPRRGASIRSAPSRALLRGDVDSGVDAVTDILLPHYREISEEVAPYRQRTVYSVEPELTFYELNHDKPLAYSKRSEYGREERKALLVGRLDQVDRILCAELPRVKESRLIDVAACMWSARRIFAKIGHRIPENPEWDSEGLRMEIIY